LTQPRLLVRYLAHPVIVDGMAPVIELKRAEYSVSTTA
jgi:hypothetical protein